MRRFLALAALPLLLTACPAAAPTPAMTLPPRSAAPSAAPPSAGPSAAPSAASAAPSTAPSAATSAAPSAAPSAAASAGPAKLSFKADVAPILARSCAGCHAPGKQAVRDLAIFDDAGAVRADTVAARVDDVIAETESGGMPRGGRQKLSADEVGVLKRWRDAGTPAD